MNGKLNLLFVLVKSYDEEGNVYKFIHFNKGQKISYQVFNQVSLENWLWNDGYYSYTIDYQYNSFDQFIESYFN